MIRQFVFALVLSTAVATSAAAEIHGAWTATSDGPGRIHLMMTTHSWWQNGQSCDPASLGLDGSALLSSQTVPVNVKVVRDAGTIAMEGTFKNGDGAGQFTFTPNRSYLDAVRAMGLKVDVREDRSDDDELFRLAVIDLSRAYLRTMHDLYSGADFHDIRKARAVDVTPEYIAQLRKAGVEVTSLHDAARLRGVNVTPKFIDELASAGYRNLSTRDLIRLAGVGVDAKFIRDMSQYSDKH